MRSIHLGLYALFTSAVLMVSCAEDELIENNHHLTSSETINFDAIVEWPKDYMDSRSATSSLKRVESPKLRAEEGSEILPMGVYVQDGIYPITTANPESRGAVITKGDLNSFNVWATLNKAQSVGGGSIEYIAGQEFTNTDGVFSSNGTKYYWPGEGPTIDFLAVGNANDAFVPTMTGASGTFAYTVPASATAQNDIVVAKAASIPGNKNASVPLDFQHIMSAVNVKVGSEMTAGTINSITFKNIKSTGTYDVANETWKNVGTPTSYTVTFGEGSNTVTESTAEGTLINGTDATFMMIPQALTDISETEKVEIIVNFTYATTGNEKNLKASLSGQVWAQGKTTNYYINVSPDFTLSIEEESVPIADCHYDMRVITISDDQGVGWTLNSDVDWLKFRLMPDDYETNENYAPFKNYWIETNTVTVIDITLNSNGEETNRVTHDPVVYGLSSTLSGSGTQKVLVYYDENAGTIPTGQTSDIRTSKITLYCNGNEYDAIEATQFYPLWNNNNIAYERIEEENATYPWGFNSDLKMRYDYPSIKSNIETGWGEIVDWIVNGIIELIRGYNRRTAYDNFIKNYPSNAYPSGFLTMGRNTSSSLWGEKRTTEWWVILDYSKLSALGNIGQATNGLDNTIGLINFLGSGNSSVVNLENYLKNNMDDTYISGTNDGFSIEGTAIFQIAKKNKMTLSTIITNITSTSQGETRTEQNVETFLNYSMNPGIVWYIPAKEELNSLINTIGNNGDTPLSETYWSSSAATNNTQAYKYTHTTQEGSENNVSTTVTYTLESRKNTHHIRAARMKPITTD